MNKDNLNAAVLPIEQKLLHQANLLEAKLYQRCHQCIDTAIQDFSDFVDDATDKFTQYVDDATERFNKHVEETMKNAKAPIGNYQLQKYRHHRCLGGMSIQHIANSWKA